MKHENLEAWKLWSINT